MDRARADRLVFASREVDTGSALRVGALAGVRLGVVIVDQAAVVERVDYLAHAFVERAEQDLVFRLACLAGLVKHLARLPGPRAGQNIAVAGEKRAENEAIFRASNERLKEHLAMLEADGRIPFVCECSDADCMQAVELSPDEYNDVRQAGDRFIVLRGHEDA